jgi:hypothetical protein
MYVTVMSVWAHTPAGPGIAGWHVIAQPSTPIQIDLLDSGPEADEPITASDCLMASVGLADGLPPATYTGVRVVLAENGSNPAPASNACEPALPGIYSCVELNDGTTFFPLKLPPSAGGFKIPTKKITKGRFTIADGKGVDLDIDIDACQSVVAKQTKKGKIYRLKPTATAGEVTLNSIISGDVVTGTNDGGAISGSGDPVPNASVWLEDPNNTTAFGLGTPGPTGTSVALNEVLARTTTNSNGHFSICPAPAGTNLELVASAPTMPNGPNPSDVTITTGITVDSTGGPSNLEIPLIEPASAPTGATQFTTQTGTPSPISETLNLGMSQSDGTNQAPFAFANLGDVSPLTTGPSGGGCFCPANTDCSCANLDVPPDQPVIGPANGSYGQAGGAGVFAVQAQTSSSSGAGSCNPSSMTTASGSSTSKPTLSFDKCQ